MESFKIRQKIEEFNVNEDLWYEKIVKVFDFISTIQDTFRNGDAVTRKEIFASLGQNFTMKDKKLSLELHEWIIPLIDSQDDENNKNSRFEPGVEQSETGESEGNSETKEF